MKERVFIFDEDADLLSLLKGQIEGWGYQVFVSQNISEDSRKKIGRSYDLVLLSHALGDTEFFLQETKRGFFRCPILIMDKSLDLETAIQMVKKGAYYYLPKPLKMNSLKALIEKVFLDKKESFNHFYGDQNIKSLQHFEKVVGNSEKMKTVFELIKKVTHSDSTVLVLGESGTGKEMIAKVIHYNGHRSEKPLITVNCGAIPEGLLESELFGHVRGSFTGAVVDRKGKFEVASGGTLFLDEIGDMSQKLQVKLLRVLQEKKVESVGSNNFIDVDVRIIAATNRDLEKAVSEEKFREDLFYRLNVIPIYLPPLRERKEDVVSLMDFFLTKYSEEHEVDRPILNEEGMEILCRYNWPGNVRELENLAQRLVVLNPGKLVNPKDLLEKFIHLSESVTTSVKISEQGISFKEVVNEFENELILKALEKTGWNKNKAALLLQLNRTTLVEKIKKRHLNRAIS